MDLLNDSIKPRVLFVEDEVSLREHLARVLSNEFEIRTASEGAEALHVVSQWRPALIVTDIVMPGMDGVELVRRLRQTLDTASIPILMISGKAADELRDGFDLGADSYLGKPYTERDLRTRMHAMLRSATLRAESARTEERARAEQLALEERAALLESITDAFYALDSQWRFTYLNQRALDYFEVPLDRLLGNVIWEVFPETMHTFAHEEFKRAVRENLEIAHELLSPISGKWVELHAYPHRGGLAVNFRDITDRKHADERLKASEARLRLMSDALPALICYVDQDYRYLFCNRGYEEWFGLKGADVEGRTLAEVVGSEAFEALKPLVDRALSGERLSVETRIPYKLGCTREVHIDYLPEKSEGHIRRYFALIQDISERKAAERERLNTEQRLRELNETLEQRIADVLAERKVLADLVEGTDAFVQVADHNYRLLAINKAAANEFERIYGVRPKVGDSMLELLADKPEHQAAVKAVWSRALAGEEFTEVGEFGDPERVRRFYEMKYNSLRDKEGRFVGAYQFVYDVTQRIEDQKRLIEALEALRQSQKMETLGQLTGGVAHDFNNLLTPIFSVLDMLVRQGSTDHRLQRLATGALQAAERAKTLIQRLLAFSRRQHLEPQPVDLKTLLEDLRELLVQSLGAHITLSIRVDEKLPAIRVDPNQLQLALLNLAVNARDAMPERGMLTVRAEEESMVPSQSLSGGRYVRIAVTDSGIGMDPETLARAIDPFFTTKPVGEGTGLGLSMVHGLAVQSGGDFKLESFPDRGTTAYLWLPIAEQDVDGGPLDVRNVKGASKANATALLVDDEALVRLGTAAMLEESGYEVIEAASAEEALQLLRNGLTVDILITDFAMPGMNGAQLVREVHSMNPVLPVLMITGFASLRETDAAGIVLLSKPFRQADLISSVAEALSN